MIQRNVPVSIQVKMFINTESNFSYKDCVYSILQWKSMGQDIVSECKTYFFLSIYMLFSSIII